MPTSIREVIAAAPVELRPFLTRALAPSELGTAATIAAAHGLTLDFKSDGFGGYSIDTGDAPRGKRK